MYCSWCWWYWTIRQRWSWYPSFALSSYCCKWTWASLPTIFSQAPFHSFLPTIKHIVIGVFFSFSSTPSHRPMSRMRENPNESTRRVPSSRTLGEGLVLRRRGDKQTATPLLCACASASHVTIVCRRCHTTRSERIWKDKKRRWEQERETKKMSGRNGESLVKRREEKAKSSWEMAFPPDRTPHWLELCVCDSQVRRRRRIKEGMRRRWRAQGIRPVYLSEHSTGEEWKRGSKKIRRAEKSPVMTASNPALYFEGNT